MEKIIGILLLLLGIGLLIFCFRSKDSGNHWSKYYNIKGISAGLIAIFLGVLYLLGLA